MGDPEIESSDEEFEDLSEPDAGSEEEAALEEAIEEASEEENEDADNDTEALIGGTSSMATMDINFNNLSATSYFKLF